MSLATATAEMRKPNSVLNRNFNLMILIALAVLILYGFGHTVSPVLIRPEKRPPAILAVHAVLSVLWLGVLVAQSLLVRTRNVATHRRLGVWGLVFGAALIVVGVWTSIVMRHIHVVERGPTAAPGMAIALGNILVSFGIPFALAAWWRRKPAFHRRLILLSTIFGFLPAAISRAPFGLITLSSVHWVRTYLSVPFLMAILFCGLVAAQDVLANRRLHPVYALGIPASIAAALFYTTLSMDPPGWWMSASLWLANLG